MVSFVSDCFKLFQIVTRLFQVVSDFYIGFMIVFCLARELFHELANKSFNFS